MSITGNLSFWADEFTLGSHNGFPKASPPNLPFHYEKILQHPSGEPMVFIFLEGSGSTVARAQAGGSATASWL